MRILLATDSFPPRIDGVAETAATIARRLSARGHDVLVAAPFPGPSHADGYELRRVRSLPVPFYREFPMALPPIAVAHAVRRQPPDAAIVLTAGVLGLWLARSLPAGTRLIHIYTTDVSYYASAYGIGFLRRPIETALRWLSRRADVTLCPTELARGQLAALGHPRLQIWGRGVDTDLFNPDKFDYRMRWRLSGGEPEKPLILYVGRLAREKRLLDLLEAAKALPFARFAVVGDGPQRDLLEREFATVPTVFTGFLRGETLAQAFASADVFAFPSESETFGQVVLQAMASGLPPVVVAGTAPAELVADAMAGLHVAPRSTAALSAALASLAGDRERRRALGREARLAASRYSWDALLCRLETLLQNGVAANESESGDPR